MSDSLTTDAILKKNDDAIVGSKSWQAYMATLMLDFLFIMVPIVLVYTVSFFYLSNYENFCRFLLLE